MTTNPHPEDEMKRKAKLLPCPFCGSEPITEPQEEYYTVTCSRDGCVLGNMAVSKAAWNTRAATSLAPADGLGEAVVKCQELVIGLVDHGFRPDVAKAVSVLIDHALSHLEPWVKVNGPEDLPKESGDYTFRYKYLVGKQQYASHYYDVERETYPDDWMMFGHWQKISPPADTTALANGERE